MSELKRLFLLLEERLVQHDDNRKEVQSKLLEICSRLNKDPDTLEERINQEMQADYIKREEQILGLIARLNEGEEDAPEPLVEQAREELSVKWRYEIKALKKVKSFTDSFKLVVTPVNTAKGLDFGGTNKAEFIMGQLQEHLDKLHDAMAAAQDKLAAICNKRRSRAERLKKGVMEKLEQAFFQEDERIQSVVKVIRENVDSKDPDILTGLVVKAKATLVSRQSYSLVNPNEFFADNYDLVVTKEATLESIDFSERKPADLVPLFTEKGDISLSFAFFSMDEVEAFRKVDLQMKVWLLLWEKGLSEETAKMLVNEYTVENDEPIYFQNTFSASTTYCLKARIEHQGANTKWSDVAEFTTPGLRECCVWRKCPDYLDEKRKYLIDEKNPRIASKKDVGCGNQRCTIVGSITLPRNAITSWNIKVVKTGCDGNGIYIGVAPFDIGYSSGNYRECGWYFNCYDSTLWSGPPHKYSTRVYGPRKEKGEYVHTGDSVGVVMDTAKGELSFVLNGVNLGVAYEGIPLDKPLVPCVILGNKGDSIELDTSEVKENIDSSIPVPSNITAESITTWDSITLTWDAVEGASLYQIEVDDGNKFWGVPTSTFTRRGLLPETEHTFRVRAVRGNAVGEWSDVVKGVTGKAPDFSECVWKECPEDVREKARYSLDEKNPMIAIKGGAEYEWSTIIGTTPLPASTTTSWSIRVLGMKNHGKGTIIGVAPSDIGQGHWSNFDNCGWYLYCRNFGLFSGPPHKYKGKIYGPRKRDGECVYIGDSVGVVMDTAKGELSFVLNGANRGVAYEGIPLDKPLVPCVLLDNIGDSVELVI